MQMLREGTAGEVELTRCSVSAAYPWTANDLTDRFGNRDLPDVPSQAFMMTEAEMQI